MQGANLFTDNHPMSDADGYFTRGAPEQDHIDMEHAMEIHDIGALVTVELAVTGDRAMEVSVVDSFPDDPSILEARFVPEHEPSVGTINDRRVRFTATVEPDDPVVVQYGLRLEDPETATGIVSPQIEHAAPIREGMADGGMTEPSFDVPEPPETEPDREAEETPSFADPDESVDDSVPEEAPDSPFDSLGDFGDDSGFDSATSPSWSDESGVLEALIRELGDAELTVGQRATIRDALHLGYPESVDVQLQHVQARVTQYGAFAEAVEAFIDAHGQPVEHADTVEERLDAIENDLAAIEDSVASAERARAVVERDLAGTRDRLADLETEVAEELGSIRDELDRAIADVESRMAQDRDAVVDDVEASIDERITAQLSDVIDDLDEVDDRLADAEETVESSMATLREEVESNSAVRSQFVAFLESVNSLDLDDDELGEGLAAPNSASADEGDRPDE